MNQEISLNEFFYDPITKSRALHDNDIEILLLLGKEQIPNLSCARLRLPSYEELSILKSEIKVKDCQE